MTAQDSVVAETIANLQRRWVEAYTERDTSLLDLYMSEDYVGIYPDGTLHDKNSEIAAIKSGDVHIKSMEPLDMTIRVNGNAAVNTGQSNVKVSVGGQEMIAELRFTSVWIKRGSQWQAVSHQVTRIE